MTDEYKVTYTIISNLAVCESSPPNLMAISDTVREASCSGSNPDIRTQLDRLHLYLSELQLERKNKYWQRRIAKWLNDFVSTCNVEDRLQVSQYLLRLKEKYHPTTYRKIWFQVKRYLKSEYDVRYLDKIRLDPMETPPVKLVNDQMIRDTIDYFKTTRKYFRYKCLIRLGYDSNLRIGELIQLTPNDIDCKNLRVYVRSDSTHHVKNRSSVRVSYLTASTGRLLERLIATNHHKRLWNLSSVSRDFANAPIHAKDLRKAWSQRVVGMDYAIKKKLMGHSPNKDIDLSFYNHITDDMCEREYRRLIK